MRSCKLCIHISCLNCLVFESAKNSQVSWIHHLLLICPGFLNGLDGNCPLHLLNLLQGREYRIPRVVPADKPICAFLRRGWLQQSADEKLGSTGRGMSADLGRNLGDRTGLTQQRKAKSVPSLVCQQYAQYASLNRSRNGELEPIL